MESFFMSIEKPDKSINSYILRSGFYFIFFTLILFKFSCFCWHAENDINDAFFFLNCQKNKDELCSGSYAVYENFHNEKCLTPVLVSSRKIPLAGSVNIDIPLSRFSKEAVEPSQYLDRLIAVNLRIKNLMEEYEEIKKKAVVLLSMDSLHFFIEKNKEKLKSPAINNKKEIYLSKTNIDKELKGILNSSPRADLIADSIINNNNSLKTEAKSFGYSYSSALENKYLEKEDFLENIKLDKSPVINTEPPWIFTFFIGILKFIKTKKYEIFFFSVLAGLFLVFIIGRSER